MSKIQKKFRSLKGLRNRLKSLKRLRRFKGKRRLLFLFVLACSKTVNAQSASSVRLMRDFQDFDQAKPLDAYVKFESIQYPTAVPGQEYLNQNNMLEAGLGLKSEAGMMKTYFDIQGGRSLNINYSYFSVKNLAAKLSAPEVRGLSLTAGRSVEFWSRGDDSWHLGLWQPLFSMDGLRPETQGLTGLHLKQESRYIQAVGFYSPLFIPSTTPDLADRNGEITSESRWFRPIPNSTELFGRDTSLYYRLSVPEIRDLVMKQSVAGRVRVGELESGAWASVAFADKPMNSIFFKYDPALRTRSSGSRAEVELRPLIHRHHLYAADVGYKYEGGELSLSYLEDHPQRQGVENTLSSEGVQTAYIQQTPETAKIASVRWDQELRVPSIKAPIYGRFDYIKTIVGPTRDFDAGGVERSSLLPHRFLYTNAVAVEARSEVAARWTMALKYLRDFDQNGSVWSAVADYRTRSKWIVSMGVDILGADDSSDANKDTRFLNSYRQNDRVYGGLSYVF